MNEEKQLQYLNIIKKIVKENQLIPDILQISKTKQGFSINLESYIIINIRLMSKSVDRIIFHGILIHDQLKNNKSLKFSFHDSINPNDLYNFQDLIIKRYNNIIENYIAFSCCSRYLECSNAKRCIHPDPLFSFCCFYNKNLKQGNIFYGKNATNN